jgi:hypothetical protein
VDVIVTSAEAETVWQLNGPAWAINGERRKALSSDRRLRSAGLKTLARRGQLLTGWPEPFRLKPTSRCCRRPWAIGRIGCFAVAEGIQAARLRRFAHPSGSHQSWACRHLHVQERGQGLRRPFASATVKCRRGIAYKYIRDLVNIRLRGPNERVDIVGIGGERATRLARLGVGADALETA